MLLSILLFIYFDEYLPENLSLLTDSLDLLLSLLLGLTIHTLVVISHILIIYGGLLGCNALFKERISAYYG